VYGHIDSGVYFPGMRDVSANLVKA
jgi:hypothetical protein